MLLQHFCQMCRYYEVKSLLRFDERAHPSHHCSDGTALKSNSDNSSHVAELEIKCYH